MPSDQAVVHDRRAVRLSAGSVLALAAPAAVVAIVAADVVMAFVDVAAGVALHGLILLALLNGYLLATRAGASGTRPEQAVVLVVLGLVPVASIVSAAMVVPGLSTPFGYVAVGPPVLVAALLTARFVGAERVVGLFRLDRRQACIGLLGVPASLLAYLAARPDPVPDPAAWTILLAPFALLLFPALTEELVYRGLAQQALVDAVGRSGILASILLYAGAYLWVRPVGFAVAAVSLGACFALLVARTGSLVGVVVAHAVLVAGAILVWPVLLG